MLNIDMKYKNGVNNENLFTCFIDQVLVEYIPWLNDEIAAINSIVFKLKKKVYIRNILALSHNIASN